MSYPAYPEVKASGVEWLGEVPQSWAVKRIRYACHLNPSKSEVANLPAETPVSFLPMEKVGTEGETLLDENKAIEDVLQGFTYFRDGDIIAAKITPCFENGKGAIVSQLTNSIGFGSTEFHVLRPFKGNVSHFIYYLTKSHLFRSLGMASMYGAGGQKRVPEDFVEDFLTAFPTLPEQEAIAAFLDRKTAELDAVIRLKERQLQLLAEKRQALISQAVTRGLDPTVPLKPSGVEWLGDVPEYWEIVRLKYLAKIKYGLGQPPSAMDDGLPLLRATNVERGKINPSGLVFIDPNDVPYDRDPVLRTNDIIVVRSGAYTGDSAIVPAQYDGAIAGYDMVVRAKAADPFFIAYGLLSVPILNNQIDLLRMRAAQPHLNAEELGECLFFMPPMAEQASIVAYLDRETVQMDRIGQAIQSQIEKLREYRQALISAAVTGKIDVRKHSA